MTNATTEVVATIDVTGTTDDGGVATIVASRVKLLTTADQFRLAEAAVDSVTGDITRGWAGPIGQDWSAKAKKYDRPGDGGVVLTVSFGGHAEAFEASFACATSVARCVVNVAHALRNEAAAWIYRTKRHATN